MCKKPDYDTKDHATLDATASQAKADEFAPTHSKHQRSTKYDWLIFLGPAILGGAFTNVVPIYLIGTARLICVHIFLSLHYQFVDKDNYLHKLSAKQLAREKSEYLTAFYLHMYVQVILQIIFPSMFFSDNSEIPQCMKEAFLMHVFFVEPLYYLAHRWLHVPSQMKSMHGFHHLSIKTTPSTALVQNLQEHFVYIATFGPSFFLPFLLNGRQHWVAIGAYLVSFDMINMWGHTNVIVRNWIFEKTPIKYLFYTPEFHLGHHAYFNANYTLFMPIWDYLFGTAREYRKKDHTMLLPKEQQDFVFIGHNGGLGHLFTIPELCIYNVYNDYIRTFLPLKVEFLIIHVIARITKLFMKFYYCTRFCIANEYIGRIIVLVRTPYDYMNPKSYKSINEEMVQLMREQHQKYGTRYFGLGNLNKMKQLNESGIEIVDMVRNDPYLQDKKIRIWTGDTMTVASVYHQIADIPNLDELFYIGAGGKIGTAVCEMLAKSHPDMKIRIFSRNHFLTHLPNISYSNDLSEIANYKVVLVGKILSAEMYNKALKSAEKAGTQLKTRFVLDYTVPALPVPAFLKRNINHIRIGLLKTDLPNNPFLKGSYDVCMSHPENHIVPCHFGCLLNTVSGRETDEVGEICLDDVEQKWKMTLARGFKNIEIDFSQ